MMVTSPTIPMNTSVRYVNRFGESVGVVGVAGVFASIFVLLLLALCLLFFILLLSSS